LIRFILILFLTGSLSTAKEPFENAYVHAAGFGVLPLADLGQVLDPSIGGELGISFSYAESMKSHVRLAVTRMEGWVYSPVIVVVASMGLGYEIQTLRNLECMAGINLNFARATETILQPGGAYYQLANNESEFGWFGSLRLPFWKIGSAMELFGDLYYAQAWTRPNPSRLLLIGIGAQVQLW
jgi:hypothetical protein